MTGPHRFWIWAAACFGATLPFLVLYFFLPDVLLESSAKATSWLDMPDKLVPEVGFIGVAIFISCAPDWLSDEYLKSFSKGRRTWLLGSVPR